MHISHLLLQDVNSFSDWRKLSPPMTIHIVIVDSKPQSTNVYFGETQR